MMFESLNPTYLVFNKIWSDRNFCLQRCKGRPDGLCLMCTYLPCPPQGSHACQKISIRIRWLKDRCPQGMAQLILRYSGVRPPLSSPEETDPWLTLMWLPHAKTVGWVYSESFKGETLSRVTAWVELGWLDVHEAYLSFERGLSSINHSNWQQREIREKWRKRSPITKSHTFS